MDGMSDPQGTRVDLDVLLRAIERQIAALRANQGGTVLISPSDYWEIAPGERPVDPRIDAPQPTIGCLNDDWDSLNAVADGEIPALPRGFVWIARVLLALSDTTFPAPRPSDSTTDEDLD